MQSISTAQRAWLHRGGLITYSASVQLTDGITYINVTNDDIADDSVHIERRSTSGTKLEVGSAETAELTLTLLNHTGKFTGVKFEGAIINLVMDINGEPLPAGIFTVDEKPQSGIMMNIRALDKMARFNKVHDGTLVYPATLSEILTDACQKCGVSLYSSTFTNSTVIITKPPDEDATYHQIIMWVSQIAGKNAYITVGGLLSLAWYSGTPETISDTIISKFEFAENDVTVTGVKYENEDKIYLAGTDTYTLDVSGNPYIETDIPTMLSLINTQVNGFTYRPISELNCAVTLPHLWPMDLIVAVDDGITYQSIITNHDIKTSSVIKAAGEPEIVKGYAGAGVLTVQQKTVIKTLAKKIAETKTSALEIELLALNDQITNALGYYTTVVTNEDGSKVVYHHDKPVLEESQYIDIKPAAGSFAWTDQGWNNGSPVWQYGFTQSGSLVLRVLSAVGINAEWIKISSTSTLTEKLTEIENNVTYKVEISNSNGNLFKNNMIYTKLTATVYKGPTDITSTLTNAQFIWTRTSADAGNDTYWNNNHIGVGKEIIVTNEDVFEKATFKCEIQI